MNTGIKLYINSINNFRINRVIRTQKAAVHAVEDLRVKLIVAEHVRRRNKRSLYDSTRLKISIRPGSTPFLATKVYWLRSEEECVEAVKDLQRELQHQLLLPRRQEGCIASHDLLVGDDSFDAVPKAVNVFEALHHQRQQLLEASKMTLDLLSAISRSQSETCQPEKQHQAA